MDSSIYQLGRVVEARDHFEQAAQLDKETENRIGESASLRSLAVTFQDIGELEQALNLHLRALTLDTDADFEYGIAIDQANIGAIHLELHDYRSALQYFGKALTLFKAWGQVQKSDSIRQLVQIAESKLA